MNAQRFPWGKLLFCLTVVIAAVLAYDIQQHGSFKKSTTGQLMKETGLLAICQQAWWKITVYTGKAYKWLEATLPVYCAWLQRTCGPYVRLFWERLLALAAALWRSSAGARAWAAEALPPLLQLANENVPRYIKALSQFTEGAVLQTASLAQAALQLLERCAAAAVAWLHANVFTGSMSTENLQKYAGSTVQAFQQYTLTTYNWISKYVATVVYPGR